MKNYNRFHLVTIMLLCASTTMFGMNQLNQLPSAASSIPGIRDRDVQPLVPEPEQEAVLRPEGQIRVVFVDDVIKEQEEQAFKGFITLPKSDLGVSSMLKGALDFNKNPGIPLRVDHVSLPTMKLFRDCASILSNCVYCPEYKQQLVTKLLEKANPAQFSCQELFAFAVYQDIPSLLPIVAKPLPTALAKAALTDEGESLRALLTNQSYFNSTLDMTDLRNDNRNLKECLVEGRAIKYGCPTYTDTINDQRIKDINFSPDSQLVVFRLENGSHVIRSINALDVNLATFNTINSQRIFSINFSPDSQFVVFDLADCSQVIRSINALDVDLATFNIINGQRIIGIDFSPDSQFVGFGLADCSLVIRRMNALDVDLATFNTINGQRIISNCFNPDNQFFVFGLAGDSKVLCSFSQTFLQQARFRHVLLAATCEELAKTVTGRTILGQLSSKIQACFDAQGVPELLRAYIKRLLQAEATVPPVAAGNTSASTSSSSVSSK